MTYVAAMKESLRNLQSSMELQAGYTVRAAIRLAEKAKSLASHPKITAFGKANNLSFVEVPDITCDGTYDEATKNITYVIHLASPLPSPFLDPQTGIYQPTIKRVIGEEDCHHVFGLRKHTVLPDPSQEITAETRLIAQPVETFDSMLPAYRAGKITSLNITEKCIKEREPSSTVINIFSGFVFGRDDRALEAGGNSRP
ncbi:hypothetical protein PENSOL_c009G06548 [Penicillium solitum]|uniref:NAD-dependent epimerase/dehydratase domain-containing protein n=1 Tax=Penicillium solitum TaxID=60172 RepID=A0A1V6RAU8_9EURO|nr:uncharacterized protein PENSOL_c009G06548 [Penicillium solitum]OQD98381.1 hypothetical protein PENSOL_c009G06548 [Penicillium solitum]